MAKLYELVGELEDFARDVGLSYDMYVSDIKTSFVGNLENVYANKRRVDDEMSGGHYATLLWVVVGEVFVEVQLREYGEDHLVFRVVSGDSLDDFVIADRIRLESEGDFESFERMFDFHVRNVMKLAS